MSGPHSAAPGVLLRDVEFAYRAKAAPAVVCPELSLRPGSVTTIMGRSGSGKSTLLNILAGLNRVAKGSVEIGGQQLARTGAGTRATFRAKRCGLIFQDFGLIDGLRAWENVSVGARIAGVKLSEAECRGALRALGLEGLEERMNWELSGGQQQRVAIARALAKNPAIILADEPTSALDETTTDHVWNLLRERAARQGCTVVCVTHDPELAGRADAQVVVQDGVVGPAAVRAGSFA